MKTPLLALVFLLPSAFAADAPSALLTRLHITPSAESLDYVANKTQFQLHTLVTEQRHPKTRDLSARVRQDTTAGLRELFSVDEDVTKKLAELARKPAGLQAAAEALTSAIREHRKIYFYGCGATGRLAKQVESAFWRPFWLHAKKTKAWPKLAEKFADAENSLIGEMTGADRALISSLPGFEDLPVIGRRQLEDRGIRKGDVVFAVTEGGETSSVIGTALGAVAQYGELSPAATREASRHIFFVYNNPDAVLRPFERSRQVLDNPAITKIPLFTGPQALAGSTRLQATTSETFVAGILLEHALDQALRPLLTAAERAELGFRAPRSLADRLRDFAALQTRVAARASQVAAMTDAESATYAAGRFTTYFADDALIAVFTDSTERAPTFRLLPLDTVDEAQRKSWIQVWSSAATPADAWDLFLHRPFRGLAPEFYEPVFRAEIADPFLKEAALKSLKDAGSDQQARYDFSFSEANVHRAGPQAGDLGVLVLLSSEKNKLADAASPVRKWLDLFQQRHAPVFAVLGHGGALSNARAIDLDLPLNQDPLGVREQIAIKMLLNAHSTAVMAKLGKIVGNTMTNVNPGNLKLIGRATYLIQSHVNDAIARHPGGQPIGYAEANAVLFDAIAYRNRQPGQVSEVGLAIVRILETLRGQTIEWREAEARLEKAGLGGYLAAFAW